MKTPLRPKFLAFLLTVKCVGSASLGAQTLAWDADAAAGSNPSDGGGAWFGANLWWTGGGHTTWDNTVNSSTIAVIGSGGTSGTITIAAGGVDAGGLKFGASSSKGYIISGGSLRLATNAIIEIENLASNAGAGDRVRLTTAISGTNITISNTAAGTSYASYATLSGTNGWDGTLTLAGNASGLFVDATTPNALNSLPRIDIGTTATLALNSSATTYSVANITMGGTGLASRGSLRFDNGTVTLSSNITLTSDGRMSTNSTGIGMLTGVISGSYNLAINSNTDTINRIVFKNTTNHTYGQLTISRGNVQIGEGGVGTSGAGVVNLAGGTTNPATLSGTGKTLSGLYVSGGTISPGDNGGMDIGTLAVGGNLNFTGISTAQTAASFTVAAGGVSDRINVTNNLLLDGDGSFKVAFATGYTPTVGDAWTLLNWGGTLTQNTFSIGDNLRTGADGVSEGNLDLPNLTAEGYLWEVALGGGALTAKIVIPEPSHVALGALGLFALLGYRRR